MENKMLPLLQSLIGIAVLLFGVILACVDGYGYIVGLAVGVVGLLICITAYLRTKALSENQKK